MANPEYNDRYSAKAMTVTRIFFPPVHPEGWKFVVIFIGITLLLAYWLPLMVIPGIIIVLLCLYFFRDPKRVIPKRKGVLVSPADGIVQMIAEVMLPSELNLESNRRIRISVFMNLFNCHVNRIPIGSIVLKSIHCPGQLINAALSKASESNERQVTHLMLPDGRDLVLVQIAGFFARRICCNLHEGMSVKTGTRFGLIRFGSRVDIYLPENIVPLVEVGQTVIAGETILADLN